MTSDAGLMARLVAADGSSVCRPDQLLSRTITTRPIEAMGGIHGTAVLCSRAKRMTAYERYVFVPVVPNEADAATLGQLPGVDATLAAQLIAGRPYALADAFLARLAQHLPADQATAARGYLTVP